MLLTAAPLSSLCSVSTGRMIAIRLIALAGIVLSAYAVYVEHKVSAQKARAAKLGVDAAAADEEAPFVALCDLGAWASCSDVLTSPSSRLFGPPNAVLGFIFYCAVFLYPSINFVPFREELLLLVTAFSCSLSVYLATVLYDHTRTRQQELASNPGEAELRWTAAECRAWSASQCVLT